MADEDLTLRMRTRGGRESSREVDRFGKSVRGVGSGADRSRRSVGRLGGSVRLMSGGLKSSIGIFSGAAGALGVVGLAGAASTAINEFREARKVGRQTNAVLRSTGSDAWIGAAGVGDLANALSLKLGVDDEAIQSTENLILTFRNIRNEAGKGNDIFNQTTKASLDMAAALGGDSRKSAMMLAKALNDPEKGMTRLTRAGVTFSDQQVDQVKKMSKAGDTLGAQRVILNEVRKEFAGSAAAQADPIEKMQVAWANLMEMLGGKLWPLLTVGINRFGQFVRQVQNGTGAGGRFRDEIVDIGNDIKNLAVFLWDNRNAIIAMAGGIGGAVIAFKAFMIIQQVIKFVKIARGLYIGWRAGVIGLTIAQYGLNGALIANPIGLIVGLLAGLAVGLYILWKRSDTFREKVTALWETLKAAPSGIWEGIKSGLTATVNFIIDQVNGLIGGINKLPGVDIGLIGHVGGFEAPTGPRGPGYATGSYGTPGAAQGGVVNRPGMVEVGERGRERLWLPQGAKVEPSGGLSSDGNTWIAATFVTPEGEVMGRQVVRASRRRKGLR